MVPPLLVLIALLAQSPQEAPKPQGKSSSELRALFQQNCVKCHGPDGTAVAADGKKLGGRDFTDAKKMAKETDEGLAKTIRKGIFFGQVMPAFKDKLTEEEALRMVKEVVRPAAKGKVIAPE